MNSATPFSPTAALAGGHTMVDALLHYAQAAPQRAAYVDELGEITFSDLKEIVLRQAAWLTQSGVRKGQTVALGCERNTAAARRDMGLAYALAYLGAVALPLYPEVPQAVCESLIERYRADWLIAAGAPPRVRTARTIDPWTFDAQAAIDPAQVPRGDDARAPASYSFTSGTTGVPKATLHLHGEFFGREYRSAQAFGMADDDRQMSAVPWPSIVGARFIKRAHAVGAAFVNAPMTEGLAALRNTLERFGVTRLALSPWQVRRLLYGPSGAPLSVRSLHVIGAYLDPDEIMRARSLITPNLLPGYSTGETGTLTLLPAGENPLPGYVGRLLPGVEIRVAGESGEALAAGEVGELGFRVPMMNGAYSGNPEASGQRFRDGWFYPGDVGSIDGEGRLYVRGRKGDVINFGGMKIWPEEVEAVLKQHPDIADAAVAGLPEPMSGQVPVAFVVCRRPLTQHDIQAFCAQHIEMARIPHRIAVIDAIPRNTNGKILRDQLIAAFHAAAER